MAGQVEDITLSKPILEMVTVANEYCHFIDNWEKNSKKGIL